MSARTEFPNRSLSENFGLDPRSRRYRVTVGRLPDESLIEVFIANPKGRKRHRRDCARNPVLAPSARRLPRRNDIAALSRNSDGFASGVVAAVLEG